MEKKFALLLGLFELGRAIGRKISSYVESADDDDDSYDDED